MTVAELTLPRFTGWALPDDALEVLAGIIRDRRPGLVLEAGSGRSTVALAAVLRAEGFGRLVSLEHLPEHQQLGADSLKANGLDVFAEVRLALISPETGWYANSAWQDLEGIEMLIVDGPPGHHAPFAREPALPLLHRKLARDCVVVLDDTYRSDERKIWERWRGYGLSGPTFVLHSTGSLAHGVIA